MSALRQTIASFDGQSSDTHQLLQFQGSTMFFPIITTPLAIEIPIGGTLTPSQPTSSKPKKKRIMWNPIVKRSRTTLAIQIVDPTDEVGQSIFASPIVEEIPPTTFTILF